MAKNSTFIKLDDTTPDHPKVDGLSIVNNPGAIHHRRTRGMGGARDSNYAENCVVVCDPCHQDCSSNWK